MRYLLLMYNEEQAFDDAELAAAMDDALRTCHDLAARGQYVDAAPLQPVATATSVRVRDGKTHVTDGPMAETKEGRGGYVLVDVDNVEDAVSIASRFPSAIKGTVEIRRLDQVLPNDQTTTT